MSSQLTLSLIAVFLGLAVVFGALLTLVLQRTSVERRRLRAVAAGPGQNLILDQPQLVEAVDPTLSRLSKALPRSPKEMTRLRRHLAGAGHYGFSTAVIYSLAELLLPLLLGGAVLLWLGVRGGWVLAGLAGVLGYLLPGLWLQRETVLRRKAIQHGLPDALDLFIVCMEAGSSLDQAIVKATDELEISHPALTEELRFVTTEIRAGKPRLEAFRNFSKRTGVDDVRTLVALLVQTDRFGTSVAQALRTHASQARIKRRQLAEERARKIGVKLVFPLVLLLFPGVYVICIGPAVIAIYRALF